MATIAIRAYRPDDLESCRELWRELTQRHRDIYGNQGIGGDDPGAYFDATYLKDPKLAGAWVAERDGAVVGLTGMLVDGDEAEVEPVVVSAAHRSAGIGGRLIEHVIEDAKARGLGSIKIRPVARNAEAIRCFFRHGFDVLGHVEMFQKLKPSDQEWVGAIDLHGNPCRY
ncbi:MAG: GNAT family N-acetyltransferase [Planctomycetota bacterium]|jgi:GNAT superfamily N-acetyltransferase